MTEWYSFFELLGMLVTQPRTGVLLLVLITAAIIDWKTFRIPNWLSGSGIIFGLSYNAAFPPYLHAGWGWAPTGMLIGFLVTIPFYSIRVIGAGDVKLMAMVGSFLGPGGTLYALLFTSIIAGFSAVGFAVTNHVLARLLTNVKHIVRGVVALSTGTGTWHRGLYLAENNSVGRMAYGINIALGTSTYVVAQQFGLI